MRRKIFKSVSYPETEVVILAGGQARRMNGINKLLQKFDDEIQLIKIHQQLKLRATKVWVNSHRDHSIYERLIPSIGFFEDEATGFHTIDGDEKCMDTCAIRLCAVRTL